jgi:hypothetical protein
MRIVSDSFFFTKITLDVWELDPEGWNCFGWRTQSLHEAWEPLRLKDRHAADKRTVPRSVSFRHLPWGRRKYRENLVNVADWCLRLGVMLRFLPRPPVSIGCILRSNALI